MRAESGMRAVANLVVSLLTTASLLGVAVAPWWMPELLALVSDLPE